MTTNDEMQDPMPDIDWFRADQDAQWLAGSTADSAERNLARAYLSLEKEVIDIKLENANLWLQMNHVKWPVR